MRRASARLYHATAAIRFPTISPSAPPGSSATTGQNGAALDGSAKSSAASASESKAQKAPQKDAKEAAAGMEAADAK